jgi:hypothetical protein
VEVVPHGIVISAPPGFTWTFEVEARLRTASGGLIAESYGNTPTWPVTGGGSVVTAAANGGHRAVVQVSLAGAAPVTLEAVVSATVGALTSDPSAAIDVNPTGGGPDHVVAKHTAGSPPSFALVNGVPRNSGSCIEVAVAFVSASPVGDFGGDCTPDSYVAVFSSDWAMELRPPAWTSSSDEVTVENQQVPTLPVPVAVWIAVADEPEDGLSLQELQDQTTERALLDVQYTNALLRANRAGFALKVETGFPQTQAGSLAFHSCSIPFNAKSGVLNIYFVNTLSGLKNGRSCPRYGAEDFILIALHHNNVTLAHELGHVLGLMFPFEGHTNAIRGFDNTNVMKDALDDIALAGRSHLSLGQLFRMNTEPGSWLNQPAAGVRAGRPTAMCTCDPYLRSECPRLAEDIVPAEDAGTPLEPWNCGDQVRVAGIDPTEDVAALLNGRLWRTSACVVGLPGLPFPDRTDALSLYFPNVTSAAACPSSSLTIFFADHRVIFRDIPLASDPWDLWLNQYPIESHGDDRLMVPVNVWYGSGAAAESNRDRGSANQVFSEVVGGRSNRTGITFEWKPSGLSATDETTLLANMSACAVPTALRIQDEINVYYVRDNLGQLQTDGGYSCRSGNTYYIFLPTGLSHSSTDLSHHLGKAFALGDVSAGDDLTATNVMWYVPVDGRTEFTLGQVFRMNFDVSSWLNSPSPSSPRAGAPPKYNCMAAADAGKCPLLTANVPE